MFCIRMLAIRSCNTTSSRIFCSQTQKPARFASSASPESRPTTDVYVQPNSPVTAEIPDFVNDRLRHALSLVAADSTAKERGHWCLYVRAKRPDSALLLSRLDGADAATMTCPAESSSLEASDFSLLRQYIALSKARLSALVVLTSGFGYVLAPASFGLGAVSGFQGLQIGGLLVGTALLAAGANAMNQVCEVPYDAQMARTRARPLVAKTLSTEHGAAFSILSGLGGTAILLATTNPVTAFLGASNYLLYTGVYTPMKRTSPWNTYVGAAVGALPPLMGWSAATGGHLNSGAWTLAAILFSWQMPHFMALSWAVRGDYARAGYHVFSVLDPAANRRIAVRHSIALGIMGGVIAPLTLAGSSTTAALLIAGCSLPLNAVLFHLAVRFRADASTASARRLFRYSLVYLPALLSVCALGRYCS